MAQYELSESDVDLVFIAVSQIVRDLSVFASGEDRDLAEKAVSEQKRGVAILQRLDPAAIQIAAQRILQERAAYTN